jgi:hypothetical protein
MVRRFFFVPFSPRDCRLMRLLPGIHRIEKILKNLR